MSALKEEQVPRRGAGGPKRIVLATFGSLGDLHPYIALAHGLIARGHQAVIATSEVYREKVEGEGIQFRAIRPDLPPPDEMRDSMRRIMDPREGTEFIVKRLMMPQLREQFEDLVAAARGADLLVSHMITYGAPLAAERLGMRWAASMLQPMIFTSAFDPPIPPAAPSLAFVYRLGPRVNRLMLTAIKRQFRSWVEPVDRLRAELGLRPGGNAIFEGQYSPYLNLALFSSALGPPQPDWPANTVVTGFPFYDRFMPGEGMPPALSEFLDAGPPPLVFTLGSSAVLTAGTFYVESVAAARRLNRRAVLLIGKEEWNQLPRPLPEGVAAFDYAPHSELFPRAAAIIHQGGVGTTGQAMRSGRPMLVVPFAHDQPDNAFRVTRLGIARTVQRNRYCAAAAERELRRLLAEPAHARRAEEVGRKVRGEDGVGTACDALEACMEMALAPSGRLNG